MGGFSGPSSGYDAAATSGTICLRELRRRDPDGRVPQRGIQARWSRRNPVRRHTTSTEAPRSIARSAYSSTPQAPGWTMGEGFRTTSVVERGDHRQSGGSSAGPAGAGARRRRARRSTARCQRRRSEGRKRSGCSCRVTAPPRAAAGLRWLRSRRSARSRSRDALRTARLGRAAVCCPSLNRTAADGGLVEKFSTAPRASPRPPSPRAWRVSGRRPARAPPSRVPAPERA